MTARVSLPSIPTALLAAVLPVPTVARLVSRWILVDAAISLAGGLAYALLESTVAAGREPDAPLHAASTAAIGSAVAFALLAIISLALVPALARAVRATRAQLPPAVSDRETLFAAPRIAAGTLVFAGTGLIAFGYLPAGRAFAVTAHIGAVCVVTSAMVLYAAVRLALRPLGDVLLDDPSSRDDDLLAASFFAPVDRIATRVALAVAIAAGSAALGATLIVASHISRVESLEESLSRETFTHALGVEAQRDEPESALTVAASALRGAGVDAVGSGDHWRIDERPQTPWGPPLWAIPISLAVGLLGAQVGRSIGRRASRDLVSAARRMSDVGTAEIREVTMTMARPRSVPEVREMALALDALAATLLHMADDQRRALTVRTEAARLRSFILASVSHDLRGPLNSVLGFAELLLAGVDGPINAAQREDLEALVRGGRDLLRLVGDLLDHARLDAGRLSLVRARASVDTIVEQARHGAIERARSPDETLGIPAVEVAIEGEAGLYLLADEAQVGHAVGALVAFAMLRPGSDRKVLVRTRGEGDEVVIAIRGGGTTPSRDALARMFEPFDFAPTGARAPAGLNLAVSVARGVIAEHGGTVRARPHDEGGIVLTLLLPVAGEAEGAGVDAVNGPG